MLTSSAAVARGINNLSDSAIVKVLFLTPYLRSADKAAFPS